MRRSSLILLAFSPSLARAATFTCSSGLSKGAFAAIVAEGGVILILLLVLIIVSRRQRRTSQPSQNELNDEPKPANQAERETQSLRRNPSHTSTDAESVASPATDEFPINAGIRRVTLVPTLLRPRSLTISSPPSVRSSTLYAFTPTQEHTQLLPVYDLQGAGTNLGRTASLSKITLPNPHSDHGHDDGLSESPVDMLSQPPTTVGNTDTAQRTAMGYSFAAPSSSSWAEDVVTSLSRGPTPTSHKTTVSSLLDDHDRYDNVHSLIMSRQMGSEAPLLSQRSSDAGRSEPSTGSPAV